jgi:CheY-like chemotaxis protein
LSILGDILDFSKIEAGKLKIAPVEFDLSELCKESMALYVGAAHTKNLRAEVETAARLPERIVGDAARIRQILLNLLGTSFKFTERGSVTLRVSQPPGLAGWVRFSVEDTGIGMDGETLKNLFQPFSQADTTNTRRYGGTGLGLAISQKLAQLMGGRIEAESQSGKGSSFRLLLPLPEARVSRSGEEAVPVKAQELDLSGTRVLLAEDNPVNRMVAVKLLERMGLEVETAGNGLDAFGRWKESAFDLVLMDCQMPEMDGYAATRAIRDAERAENRRRTPIVALTANAMEEDRLRCLEAGMDDHIVKPFKTETLHTTVARWAPLSHAA